MYVATINTPGYLPVDDDPPTFEMIKDAWEWLATEREHQCEMAECQHGDCRHAITAMLNQDRCGSVHAHTPGYDGDHDLGLAYSVDPVL